VRVWALVAVGAVVSLAAPARAQRLSLSTSLATGAGYDDNLFLDPTLTGAAPPRADAIIDVHPSLLAALMQRGHTLALDADYLERITPSNGDLRFIALRLAWSSPSWHRLRLAAAGLYQHYEATEFSDNTFDLGGSEASLRVELGRLWLQAAYGADARAYSDPSRNGQVDIDQQAVATASVRLHRTLGIEVAYRFLDVSSDEPTAVLERHRGEVGLTWRPRPWLSASAAYSLWWQGLPNGAPPLPSAMPGGPRHDLAHAVDVAIDVPLKPWVALFARYDFIFSTSDQPNGRYQLDRVIAGVAFGWTFAHQRVPSPPPLLPSVRGRDVTFRAQARPGAQVAVIGDWSGWQPQPLAAVGGDRYESTFTLPPGRHAWALQIDGKTVTPTQATGFVDDGFGGKNAVVDVP
jgi:hypothetical protein